eukprot:TRINITY_DN10253_c1_g1_i2.p1 TRINITY_DN10253_c1_g1~~TRINITY_DN10253_c1_g1_i2.p1  ORF type:complete len:215 (+),score=49.72 TRINITY_DN10253_c1_g1_i2:105-749(+)
MAVGFWTPGAKSQDAVKFRLLEQLLGTYTRDKGEAAYSCFTRAVVGEFYSPYVGAFTYAHDVIPNPIHTLKGFWTPYADVGLLGFYTIADAGERYARNLEIVMHFAMREFVRLAHMMSDEEFERAKNQLKVQTLLQLDGSVNIADDIGRQVLWHGKRQDLGDFMTAIDAVTKDELIACAYEHIYDKDPVVASIGSDRNVPEWTDWKALTMSFKY